MEREIIWKRNHRKGLINSFDVRIQKVLKKHKFAKLQKVKSTFLFGGVWTGKTVQAAWLCLEWHRLQYLERKSTDYIFTSPIKIFSEIKKNYGTHETAEQEILSKYKNVRLLVLDDFGVERSNEWAFQMLYEIISFRYDNEKITIYTSNLSLEQLAKSLQDDRITRRIAQSCKNSIIEFTNKPYI